MLPQASSGGQVFVRDRKTGTNLLASRTPAGAPGESESGEASLSANGRYVAFQSASSDLVAEDGNGRYDVFVTDMKTGEVTRISVTSGGSNADDHSYLYGSAVSKNGRYVAFYSTATNLVADDGNGNTDVFLRDRARGTTTLISRTDAGAPSNGSSNDPSISANGRFVTYYSDATDLAGGTALGHNNVYVYDTKTGTTALASPGLDGAEATGDSFDPVVSDNGRLVAFYSSASNLVNGDTNGQYDTFLYDRKTGTMRRVSVDSMGIEGSDDSFEPAMSANGKVLVFYSGAPNLTPEDTNGAVKDAFLVNLKTGELTLLTRNAAGTAGNGDSYVLAPCLSSNGRWLAIGTGATNLAAGDSNGTGDIYLVRLH